MLKGIWFLCTRFKLFPKTFRFFINPSIIYRLGRFVPRILNSWSKKWKEKSPSPTTSCLQQLWRAKALMSLESGTTRPAGIFFWSCGQWRTYPGNGRAGFLYPESSPMEERAHDFRTGNKAAGKLCLWRRVLTGIMPGRLRSRGRGGKIKNKFANSEKPSIIYLLEFSVYAENLVIHAFYEDRSI